MSTRSYSYNDGKAKRHTQKTRVGIGVHRLIYQATQRQKEVIRKSQSLDSMHETDYGGLPEFKPKENKNTNTKKDQEDNYGGLPTTNLNTSMKKDTGLPLPNTKQSPNQSPVKMTRQPQNIRIQPEEDHYGGLPIKSQEEDNYGALPITHSKMQEEDNYGALPITHSKMQDEDHYGALPIAKPKEEEEESPYEGLPITKKEPVVLTPKNGRMYSTTPSPTPKKREPNVVFRSDPSPGKGSFPLSDSSKDVEEDVYGALPSFKPVVEEEVEENPYGALPSFQR